MLRLALLAGAVIVAAWFGLGWVQARDTGRAQTLIGAPRLSGAGVRDAESLLNTAGTLNPDRTVDITRAQLYVKLGDPARAVTLLEQITRAEPLNLEAWRQLSIAAFTPPRTPDRKRVAAQAFRRMLSLVVVQK
jgi:predicted Zn-dependent protease